MTTACCFEICSSFTSIILIISAGIESIFRSISPITFSVFAIAAEYLRHFRSCFSFAAEFCCNCSVTSVMSVSYSLPSNSFSAPFISEASSLAFLNFLSNISRSRNFPSISFRLVDPSLIKDRLSTCEAIEVSRKSSTVPNIFLIFLSVPFLLSPFNSVSSSITWS